MTKRATFTQADVQRAIKAVKAVGGTVGAVDIRPDGSFRLLLGDQIEQQPLSDLERWELENGHRAA